MDAAEKRDALAELSEFLDRPKVVQVGGKDYSLAKLRPIDLADARDYMIRKRVLRNLDTTRGMTLDSEFRARTMAALECTPVSIYDIMNDPDGRLKLIHLSLTRHGEQTVPVLDAMRANMDPVDQDQLYAYVLWISGVIQSPTTEAPDDAPL